MNDAHTLQRLMDVHVWWHQLMGFTGTALYMRSHQYARLVQHPAMVSRIHQGSIVPFTFDYIANIEEHNATMQALQHTHLILSFRGRNVWLMSSDVDEMFMTTVPSFDVHTLLSCVQETHPDVEQVCGVCLLCGGETVCDSMCIVIGRYDCAPCVEQYVHSPTHRYT